MTSTKDSEIIVVTGASGYIATYIVKQLIEEGHRVRGTIRNLKNEDNIRNLDNLCPDAKFKLELVEANLLDAESWDKAIDGAAFVIHLASPVELPGKEREDEVIKTAVEGTLNVLKACVAAKTVRRVVVTSSIKAIMSNERHGQKPFNEDDWNSLHDATPYEKSKTSAEKAAWEFVKTLPDENKLEMAVINPSYTVGPLLQDKYCILVEIPQSLLEPKGPATLKMNFDFVDIRDVATAHVRALFVPGAAGHRHIVSSRNMWHEEVAQIYATEFNNQGFKVPTRSLPYFVAWIMSFFNEQLNFFLPSMGKEFHFDNTRMKNVLGITPRDPRPALIGMAYSLIERGFIRKPPEYRGQHSDNKSGDTGEQQQAEGQ